MGPGELISCYIFNNNDFCSLIYHYECIGLSIMNAKSKPLAVTACKGQARSTEESTDPQGCCCFIPVQRAPRATISWQEPLASPRHRASGSCCCMTVTSSDCCALALTTLKFHPLAPKPNFFIHVTRISRCCSEWV